MALNGIRTVACLDQLDQEIARADRAASISNDALLQVLSKFRFETCDSVPSDPTSSEYAQAQMELYCYLSGRPSYDANLAEMAEFDSDAAVRCPMPYSTRSTITVGEQLMAIGFLIRALDLQQGQRVLELGPGHGKTTLELAQMGPVTAVDINPRFLDVIRARSRMLGLDVECICSDMLDYRSTAPFDRVIFYECFHHCSDHIQMIRNLDALVAEGGKVYFAGEPIEDDFRVPWGIRLDGLSVYSIRKFGWLELGFRTDYFVGLLKGHGWALRCLPSRDVPWQKVFVAERSR